MDFGFGIPATRVMDYDAASRKRYEQVLEKVPSASLCIGCGGCTATCPAAELSDYNPRRVHLLLSRGDAPEASAMLRKCMLCGKCMLVCPRGVNTRGLMISMRKSVMEKREHRELPDETVTVRRVQFPEYELQNREVC